MENFTLMQYGEHKGEEKMNPKILVIDDDQELCSIIKKYLDQEGYLVDLAHTGSKGILQVEKNEYQLILLDIMLPEISGFSVLSEIRTISNVPILMLTAKDQEADKIRGLKNGADDYMTKPFSIRELLARVESLIRRYTSLGQIKKPQNTIVLKSMIINAETRNVEIENRKVELTGKEFDLLFFLASHKGMVFTKKKIFKQVWGEEYAFDDSNIMSFISKLRKKIEKDTEHRIYIQTVRGVGYRFNQEE